MPDHKHVALSTFSDAPDQASVFAIHAKPDFSPVDVNLQFLFEEGWSQTSDRLRFHTRAETPAPDHPLAKILGALEPHLLIRRYDREEDCVVSVHVSLAGDIKILSNDSKVSHRYLNGLFLECPPSFHTATEISVEEEWIATPETVAMFTGMVAGAAGWDPSHNVPPALEHSMSEARSAFDIANYRSCVVMCRRSLEALLKFAFPRLLGSDSVDNRGRALTLDAMIKAFRFPSPPKIPVHLLHIADSLRVLGNVPGAHATEIAGYRFSRFDAEFAIGALGYFVDQYFSKIDSEVGSYYSLTIDLSDAPPATQSEANRATEPTRFDGR